MCLLQGFIVRALVLPEEEYAHISVDGLNELVTLWEKMFQDLFGVTNMVYNVHLFVSINNVLYAGQVICLWLGLLPQPQWRQKPSHY